MTSEIARPRSSLPKVRTGFWLSSALTPRKPTPLSNSETVGRPFSTGSRGTWKHRPGPSPSWASVAAEVECHGKWLWNRYRHRRLIPGLPFWFLEWLWYAVPYSYSPCGAAAPTMLLPQFPPWFWARGYRSG